ncbi:transposable element Tc1 transposase [Trichonephila clavipes]|nr:transposable element Tc1 transposase [Trichonephila clavipes]
MPHRRIRAHFEQLPEFERSRIIGLQETVANDESRFQLCPDDHRRRVWRCPGQRADPAFTIAFRTGLQQEVKLVKHFLGQPDLSSFEHVWDMMGRRLHILGNVDDFSRQLEQIWEETPQETIRVLYHFMASPAAACIQARGGSTPY